MIEAQLFLLLKLRHTKNQGFVGFGLPCSGLTLLTDPLAAVRHALVSTCVGRAESRKQQITNILLYYYHYNKIDHVEF